MRIPYTLIPALRVVTVVAFSVLCAVIFSFLWVNSGGNIPMVTKAGYRVDVPLSDVDNLVFQSDVRMAGVAAGKVEEIERNGGDVRVTMDLDSHAAPLHEGATVTVRNKTLIEETYLEIADGDGAEIPDGGSLDADSGHESAQLDDVLMSLDDPTREALGETLRSAGVATDDSAEEIGDAVRGLGDLGREGGDALASLADQSEDLSEVTANTAALLEALDTGQGRIARLVRDSDTLTETMAGNREHLEDLMRSLPPMMETTVEASDDLRRLASALDPVAGNLKHASTDLSAALEELPETSADLRALLPDLDRALDSAPATLDRVPEFSAELRPLLSTLDVNLEDVNPMLSYLRPYGNDLAAFFTNFGQYLSGSDGNGNIGRVMPVYNEKTVNSPLDTQSDPLKKFNPIPDPGAGSNPQNFDGDYPRVEREERPPR